MYKANRFKK